MLCKNCNYILTGKENYCPNCAAPLSERPLQMPEAQQDVREKDEHKEQILKKEFIFPEKEDRYPELRRQSRIFCEDSEEREEKNAEKKKSYAGRIMLLIFMTCAITAGCFAVVDYFNLTSAVSGFLNAQTTTEAASSTSSDVGYSHESSIIKPDITYTPERAYIMSGEGLTLRKGPGKSFAPVTNLSDLTAVAVYGGSLSSEGWVYVYCDEKECYGWLDGSFLAMGEEAVTVSVDNSVEQELPLAE